MLGCTLEQAVARELFKAAVADEVNSTEVNLDSDAGDNVAIKLEEYHDLTKLKVLSDEVLAYDTKSGEPRIIKLDAVNVSDAVDFLCGEQIIKEGIKAYNEYKLNPFSDENICGEIPACYDLEGNLCRPFDITDGRDFSPYSDEDETCNYKRHIDINTDSHNSFIINRYLRKPAYSYIYILALAFASLTLEMDEYIDTDFMESHIKDTLIAEMRITEEEYNDFYADMVCDAVADTEHMLYALRYKTIGAEGMALSDMPYGDSVYTVFANIFGCSVFNPYVRDDNITHDIFSII